MLTKSWSAALEGIDAYSVEIEINATQAGMEDLVKIVGLPDMAVRESKSRIKSAIYSCGLSFPSGITIVNLAPADVKKEGASFDLPIALGMIASTGGIDKNILGRAVTVGELALDGRVRPLKGILPIALHAKEHGASALLVPQENAEEAAVVNNLKVFGIEHLKQAVDFLNGNFQLTPHKTTLDLNAALKDTYDADFADVKGQTVAKRALMIAAAGGHNVIMVGPPGAGKSMLAKRMPSILPPMNFEEALEISKIHSIGGIIAEDNTPIVTRRPFRDPHHSISDVGLIGGGSNPRPGEISFSHNGVLFLDELPEFKRGVLETLRQPLENGKITVSRAAGSYTFPADFMLLAAMNPCPCGYYGSLQQECRCTATKINNYRSRISGPLLDRIDIHVELAALSEKELLGKRVGETSKQKRITIMKARKIQNERFQNRPIHCNSQMSSTDVEEFCGLRKKELTVIRNAISELFLSARAYDRILRVARTIADLAGETNIQEKHLNEAIQFRSLDRKLL
ncbi:MAG: YifB family Mg chelatase-like AAA ATPase [Verrucomicrobiota bacterium]|nr:YifB family Mg chelatase-like AAA ATPase [Verrucomicrobiota bacterium]